MIQKGATIVYKDKEDSIMFYWLCDQQVNDLIFFDWYANPRRATMADFWRVTREWFNKKVEEGSIEIYETLPLDKYGDIFERQAMERNR